MPKELLLAIAGGAASAVLWIVLPVTSPLPLFAVGLGLGLANVLAAGATALVMALLVGGTTAVLYAGLGLVLPTIILVRQALLARPDADGNLEWYPPGMLAIWLAGIGTVLIVIALTLAATQSPAGAEAWVRQTLAAGLRQFGVFDEAGVALAVDIMAPLAPGITVGSWLIMLTLNGALAQALLVKNRKNLRPPADLAMFRLPAWGPAIVAVPAVVGFAAGGDLGYAARNLMVAGLVPFFLMGVALVHVLSRGWPGRGVALGLFYLLLLVFGWPMSLLLMGLGLLEHWFNWRGRQAGPPST
ncbi:MAG: hypothetical protein QNJ94_16990 [Alphaproteobacteria bacterium]|nr:hypothetical protein [Alphaproteobacteria bacterium]